MGFDINANYQRSQPTPFLCATCQYAECLLLILLLLLIPLVELLMHGSITLHGKGKREVDMWRWSNHRKHIFWPNLYPNLNCTPCPNNAIDTWLHIDRNSGPYLKGPVWMKCPFVLSNDPMPTGQGEIRTILLSPSGDGHYSNRKTK